MGNAQYSSKVQAVVAWYGLYDLIMQVELAEEIALPEMPVMNFVDMFMGISADNPGIAYLPIPEFHHSRLPAHFNSSRQRPGCSFQESVILYEKSRRFGADWVEFDAFADYLHGDLRFNEPENENRVLLLINI